MKMSHNLLLVFAITVLCFGFNNDADAQHGTRPFQDGLKPTSRDRHNNEMFSPGFASGSPYYTDNFNGTNDTTALKARGYKVYFRGTGPQGDSATWFQGDPGAFVAFNGPANGYVASNFETVTGGNTIDNWLVLPALNVAEGDSLFFYERSRSPFSGFADSLVVMYSAAGDSVPGAGSWVMLGYFQTTTTGGWTRRGFRAPAAGATARWAIRYYILDGGEFGSNSDYVGIDLITVERPDVLNDVGPSLVVAPVRTLQAHSATIAPKATFRNFGLTAQSSISVSFSISPGGYQSTKTIAALAPGASTTVTFDSTFVPAPVGTFNATVISNLGIDQNRQNDTLRSSFNVVELNWGGGGPNSGGYYYANSISVGAPSRPTYAWIDPVASGHIHITSWIGTADDGYFRVPTMPFSFPFFGVNQPVDSLFIGSNGYVSFRRGYDATANIATIPDNDPPNNMIAACAMDLDMLSTTSPAAKVYYGGDANRFVITYLNARAFGSATDSITFQIILQQSGRIKIQYDDAHSTTSALSDISIDALIGLENSAGTLGIEYRNDGVGGPMFGSPLAIEFGTNPGTLTVEEIAPALPHVFALSQNYPNPFNPTTTIAFALPVDADVDLAVYDVLGKKVVQLVDGRMSAGYHRVGFSVSDRDGKELASGVYLYRLTTGVFVQTRKLLVLR